MIEVRVNNETFSEFRSVTLQRSLNKPAGAFSIDMVPPQFSNNILNNTNPYPIKMGDLVQIIVDGTAKCTGYVDSISGTYNSNDHSINIDGRDTTQDLIDSSVPDAAKNFEGYILFQDLCRLVISALGANISVTSVIPFSVNTAENNDSVSAGTGLNAMEFLTNYARKGQVYIVPDGSGGIEIIQPSGLTTGALLINEIMRDNSLSNTNIKSSRFSQDDSERYNKYVCKSSDNFGIDQNADYETGLGTNLSGTVIDSDIRVSRYIEIQSEQTMTAQEVQNRCNEESNLRRASSNEYNVTVQGHTASNGDIYDIGQTVTVSDNFALKQGAFTIIDVKYRYSLDSGSETEISLSSPDAFRSIALVREVDNARSSSGWNERREALGLS